MFFKEHFYTNLEMQMLNKNVFKVHMEANLIQNNSDGLKIISKL